jgi:copper chaperone CopZ
MFIKMKRNKLLIKKISLLMLVIVMAFTFSACSGEESNLPTAEQITEQNLTETELIVSEESNPPAAEQITEQNLIETELTVWGMTCNRCVRQISSTVSALDGVIDVFVDLRAETVTVVHDPSVDVDTIKESITAEGYNIP